MTTGTENTLQTQIAARRAPRTREEIEMMVAGILKWVLIGVFVLLTAFPFYWMVVMSVRDTTAVLREPTRLLPTLGELANFTQPYMAVLEQFRFGTFITNSLVV